MPSAVTSKKERSCFQCSRRRIVCDRTEPSCLKCAKKGIECSGLGRIRFAEGVAGRGRFKNCKIPRAGGDDGCKKLPTITEFQALRWPGEERAEKKRKGDLDEFTTAKEQSTPSLDARTEPQDDASLAVSPGLTMMDKEEDAEVQDIGRGHDSVVTAHSLHYNIAPWIAPIDPKLRMLFSYCTLSCYLCCSTGRLLITTKSPKSSPQPW